MKELLSPGVEVFIDDQSQYIQGSTNSVPYVLLATASNKASGAGIGVAPGTLPVNANNVYLVTSQRELLASYGKPLFYTTSSGTPINGDELNEYGLLAAYSALGISNRCYVQRVDINLEDLKASVTRPLGRPDNGQYWLDTANTQWGIQQWDQVTGIFTTQKVNVILDPSYTDVNNNNAPVPSYGNIGQYAVVAFSPQLPIYFKHGAPSSTQTTSLTLSEVFNQWVQVGTDDWMTAWPTITGVSAPQLLPIGSSIEINGHTITVTTTSNTVATFAALINSVFETAHPAPARPGVYAAVINGRLMLYGDSHAIYGSLDGAIYIRNVSGTLLTAFGIDAGTYNVPRLQSSPSYDNPRWNVVPPPNPSNPNASPTGSVWLKTNNVNLGANFVVKKYDSVLDSFIQQACKVYPNDVTAIYNLDPAGGGAFIPAGTLYAEYDPFEDNTAAFTIYSRYSTGATAVAGYATPGVFTAGSTFLMKATEPNSSTYTNAVKVTLSGTTAQSFIADVSSAALANVSAYINSAGQIVLVHATGGNIILQPDPAYSGVSPIILARFASEIGVNAELPDGAKLFYELGVVTGITLSNWVGSPIFNYIPLNSPPNQDPLDGTYWYYSVFDQADIMIQNNGAWCGYRTVQSDIRGYNLSQTNQKGVIYGVTPPKTQNNQGNTPLVPGDLWIDTTNLIDYPRLSRWEIVNGEGQWVLVNNADQTTENGILFADARWSPTGAVDPVIDAIPSITSLLISSYVDLDAPNPALYPQGTLLFNTRRSGFNVKTFQVNYFTTSNPDYSIPAWNSYTPYVGGDKVVYSGKIYVNVNYDPYVISTGIIPGSDSTVWQLLATSTWVTASQNNDDGTPNMGRNAQRIVVVTALKAGVDNSSQARQEQLAYNLLACPQYPELCPNLVTLNDDRNDTGLVIGDTPLRLSPVDLQAWIAGTAAPYLDKNEIVQIGNQYTGIFYPSCQTLDLSGNTVVTAPSHMMIRTIIRSDQLSWPWFAPAGVRRGLVENAIRIGYLNSATNEFVSFSNDQATRDLLYTNHINPITFQPGVGILNFGNKTATSLTTAMDRINVARLVSYIRVQLYKISQQFLFEPNDQLTRDQFRNAVTSLMLDIQTKRGIYDYLVICDLSNNTPATIDRNELWLDLAIEPVKAVEFIYIPVRILNTGEIAGLTVGA